MFAAARLLGEIFEWLRQPTVVAEILAGIILGPSVLKIILPSDVTNGIAEIGVIVLLFTVGLETKPRDLLKVGGRATLVALLGVVIPFLGGWSYLLWLGHSSVESIFVGTALVATSVGITARILADMKILDTTVARVILGAAVVDDILGMIFLAVVSSLSHGRFDIWSLVIVAVEAVVFTLLIVFWGSGFVGRLKPGIDRMRSRDSAFAISMIACLGLSVAASYIGIAAIIGAFLAGLSIADHADDWNLKGKVHALYEFLVPFFFVVMGVQMNLKTLWGGGILLVALVVSIVAILTKLIGCGLGAAGMGMRDALRVGWGMVPRGEVGIIVALVGLRMHAISDTLYSVILVMTMITTLLAPPVLRFVFRGL